MGLDAKEFESRFRSPDAEGILWLKLAETSSAEEFCNCWLALQCSMIDRVAGGLVLLGEPDKGPFSPVAVWPDVQRDMQYLVPAAEQALTERRGVLLKGRSSQTSGVPACHIAYPVEISGKLHGVVVVEVSERPEDELQTVLRQLHWGSAGIEVIFRRKGAEQNSAIIDRMAAVMELTVTSVQPSTFQDSAVALVNEFATRLNCDRVSLGKIKKGFVHVVAISHTAKFDKKTNLVQCIESAMEEALDQQTMLVYPQDPDGTVAALLHQEMARRYGASAICTAPLPGREHVFGALMLERKQEMPFDEKAVEMCRASAHLLGPVLESQWNSERWFGAKLGDAALRQWEKLAGPGHVVLKAVLALILAAVVFFSFAEAEYRVSAKTVIEGSVQRSVSAPFDGFLSNIAARPGDVVRKGQLLCTLDERDLALEKTKWLSEGEQRRRIYQESLANHDRAEARTAEAQIHQAEAEVALLDEKLAHARIEAPFEALVVSGDLMQRLGSPVKHGEELFKLSPLEQYRVVLQVDEREIVHVAVGQKGALVLSGLSHEKLPFAVKKITAVSVSEGGRNYFRVEAALGKGAERLRPGMEGIGKIETGRRKLIWIWTHGLIDWFRLWIWSWWL